MKAQMTRHINRAKNQFQYMVLAMIFFTMFGWFAPFAYYKYIDKTVYYDIYTVQTQKKEYQLCEPAILHVIRTSKINTSAIVTINLYKKNDGGIVYDHVQFTSPITEGDRYFEEATLKIPCKSIPPGEYFYEGVVTYSVDRVEKKEIFHTNTFVIKGDIYEISESARSGNIIPSPTSF